MRRMKGMLKVMGLVLGLVILFGVSTAHASGYPLGITIQDDGSLGTGNIIVVGKFGSGFTSVSDADNVASAVTSAVSLLGLGSNVQVYPPSLFGSTDADTLKSIVKGGYTNAGYSLYVFLDIKRVASVSSTYGNNIRIDAWAADFGLLPEVGGYAYVTSIEVPESYLAFVSLL